MYYPKPINPPKNVSHKPHCPPNHLDPRPHPVHPHRPPMEIHYDVTPDAECKKCMYFKRKTVDTGVCFFNPPVFRVDLEIYDRPVVDQHDFCSKFTPI